jgi:outer membrane protein assembly factor BamB
MSIGLELAERSGSLIRVNRIATVAWVVVLVLAACTTDSSDSTTTEAETISPVPTTTVEGTVTSNTARTTTTRADATVTTSALIDGAVWATPGVGMNDAFFADGRLLASDGERLFVADGLGSFDDSPRMVTAISPNSGSILWQQDFANSIQQGLFLQAVSADRLLVSVAEGQVWTLDTSTGEILREFDLLPGYGAAGTVASDDVYFLGADTSSEGNVDPPHIMSVNFDDGSLNWQTPLAEGTDLQPIAPTYANGTLIVTSTLSHPGSADGNMVHALDSADGSILWSVDLGGDQQFKFFPSLVVDNNVIVSGPDGAVALSLTNGEQAWTAPNAQPLALGPDRPIYAYAPNGVVTLDPDTGESDRFIDLAWSPRYAPIGLWFIRDQVVISDGIRLRAFSQTSGEVTFDWSADPGAIVDFPIHVATNLIAIPIGRQSEEPPADRGVVGLELP